MIIPMKQVMYSKSPISPSILLFEIVACLPFYNYLSVLHLKICLSIYIKHMHTHNCFMALWILSGTTWVRRYRKKHSPTHTYHGHQSSLICFLHPIWSMASSLFSLCTWQSFSTIPLQVFIGLPLGLAPPFHTPYISSANHCLLFAAHTSTKIVI